MEIFNDTSRSSDESKIFDNLTKLYDLVKMFQQMRKSEEIPRQLFNERTDDIILEPKNKLLTHTNNPYPIPSKTNEMIEIRKSPIHGYGVFAKSKITAGSVITFYPAHCVKNNKNKREDGTVEHSFAEKVF